MKAIFLPLIFFVVLPASVQADTLFRWKDKEGKVHYGDKPSADAVNPESKRFGASATTGEDYLPYSLRKAKQDFPVTLYVSRNCGDYCVQAQALLNKRGVPFTEKNISTKEEVEAFKSKTGGDAVPTLIVGKTILRGYENSQWNSVLDLAGYPKTAPYGMRPVPSVQTKSAEPEKTVEPEIAVEPEKTAE